MVDTGILPILGVFVIAYLVVTLVFLFRERAKFSNPSGKVSDLEEGMSQAKRRTRKKGAEASPKTGDLGTSQEQTTVPELMPLPQTPKRNPYLESAARSAGISVATIQSWVDEKTGKTSKDSSRKSLYKILDDLEKGEGIKREEDRTR